MPSLSNKFSITLVFFITAVSCYERGEEASASEKKDSFGMNLPNGFPEMDIPKDNPLTADRVELGEKLFFDVSLSKDSSISCVTCHRPESAFADTLRISPGIKGKMGFRNAPSILNAGYLRSFMLDGGVPTLEIQVVHPLTDTNEMGFGINEVVERLAKDTYYAEQSLKAYGRKLDAFVITRALSAYERTLISGDSRFDRYKNGDMSSLTESEINGMDLFFSERLNCTSCHSGILFTNGDFENNGSKVDYSGDHGRERITHKKEDIGKFRVPSLRNLKMTFPYMHDGSFPTLEEVVAQYDKGGSGHVNQSESIKTLNLTSEEKNDLIQFLKCL